MIQYYTRVRIRFNFFFFGRVGEDLKVAATFSLKTKTKKKRYKNVEITEHEQSTDVLQRE